MRHTVLIGSGSHVPSSLHVAVLSTCGAYLGLQVNIISSPGILLTTARELLISSPSFGAVLLHLPGQKIERNYLQVVVNCEDMSHLSMGWLITILLVVSLMVMLK